MGAANSSPANPKVVTGMVSKVSPSSPPRAVVEAKRPAPDGDGFFFADANYVVKEQPTGDISVSDWGSLK